MTPVIPAQAGIHPDGATMFRCSWIPAYAGMTRMTSHLTRRGQKTSAVLLESWGVLSLDRMRSWPAERSNSPADGSNFPRMAPLLENDLYQKQHEKHKNAPNVRCPQRVGLGELTAEERS